MLPTNELAVSQLSRGQLADYNQLADREFLLTGQLANQLAVS